MPLYEYDCPNCGRFPVQRGLETEKPAAVRCPKCGTSSPRVFGCAAIHWHCEGATRGRVDPFRTKEGRKPNYPVMEERAMETAHNDQKAGIRED